MLCKSCWEIKQDKDRECLFSVVESVINRAGAESPIRLLGVESFLEVD